MKLSFVFHRGWALLLAATVLLPGLTAAQTSTGSIRGTTLDNAGAPLAGAGAAEESHGDRAAIARRGRLVRAG
jgi:hypothetical protein